MTDRGFLLKKLLKFHFIKISEIFTILLFKINEEKHKIFFNKN